jgi:GTPase
MSSFVDLVQVNLRGGDGGAGAVSFRREAHVPKGGPDGGDGGAGGDVYLLADRNVASLLAFRDHPHRRAESGKHGSGNKRHGATGSDLVVSVPEGTVVKTRDGELLADLVRHGDRYLAARGGRGGRGNARFLSNARRAPGFAEQGEYGEELWLRLEVKLLADAALVGFPNAGKSTLIAAVSAAKPKIANYPFTTLEPNLGVVRFRDHEYVVADIPGLIEGAAEGRGLGHEFLRHVERARVLVLLLDLAPVDERPPEEQARILLDELGRYRPDLLARPRLLVGTKADVATMPLDLDAFAPDSFGPDDENGGPRVLTISAVTRLGLDELLGRLGTLVGGARAAEPEPEPFVLLRPAEEGFSVLRDDDGAWRVSGRNAERVVAMADLTNIDAMEYVQHRLRTMGVERALARAGAREGDVVRIGPVELDYLEGIG